MTDSERGSGYYPVDLSLGEGACLSPVVCMHKAKRLAGGRLESTLMSNVWDRNEIFIVSSKLHWFYFTACVFLTTSARINSCAYAYVFHPG